VSGSLGRVAMLVAVAAGIYWAATTFLIPHSNGGLSAAAAAVSQAAASRGLPTNDVKCGTSPVAPSSISYVANNVLPNYSNVQLFECGSLANPSVGGSLQWCVVTASGPGQPYAQNESCQAWAAAGP
jgi:hypothetical protein